MTDQAVPQVAVKTHLDGDPRPRPDEIAEWDAIRKEHGLDQMLAMILLPNEAATDGPFPGYEMAGWAIRDGDDGKTVCEPEDIDVQIVPDEDPDASLDALEPDGSYGYGHRMEGGRGDS